MAGFPAALAFLTAAPAQRKRWAAARKAKAAATATPAPAKAAKKKRRLSPEGRARIVAATKRRVGAAPAAAGAGDEPPSRWRRSATRASIAKFKPPSPRQLQRQRTAASPRDGDTYCLTEGRAPRRASHEDFVLAREQLPSVLIHVEDGQV